MDAQWWLLIVGVVGLAVCGIVLWAGQAFDDKLPNELFPLFVTTFVAGFVFCGVAAGGALGVGYAHSCSVQGDGLRMDSKWSYAADCQVRYGDLWISIDKYRVTLEEPK